VSLTQFAAEYDSLPPGDQALFADSIRRLLGDGLIWREDEADRRLYNFLARRADLVREYLAVAGWELRFHDRANIYQVIHPEGAHRRRLNRKTTIWLLVLRLLYAEIQEKPRAALTRYPVVTVADVVERFSAFFPGQRVREKTSLDEALRTLQSIKLIRAANGGALRARDVDKQIELLPALEVVVPAHEVAAVAEKLADYRREAATDDSDAIDDDL
jgi:hypothetical protein